MFGDLVNNFLEEEHILLRDTVRRFARERVSKIAERIDREDEFPEEIFKEMASLGLTGILIPEEYGGAGVDLLSAVIVLEELARESASVALILLAHSVICGYNIVIYGNEELKKKYLPRIASGEVIGGFAVTEPNAGSDVLSIQTTAHYRDGYYYINGSKIFITNGPVADVIVVYAKTDPEAGRDGITSFIVEKDFPGFSRSETIEKMGFRGCPTGILYFEDMKVPEENVLGELNKGYYQMVKNFEIERIIISAIGTGIALSALSWQVRHANERKQFGKLIKDFELIQEKIAETGSMLDMLRTYLFALAKYYTEEKDFRMESASIKLLSGLHAVKSSLEAIQVLGGYGYTKEYPVERFFRDSKLLEIGAGTSEIMKIIIARRLLKDERLKE